MLNSSNVVKPTTHTHTHTHPPTHTHTHTHTAYLYRLSELLLCIVLPEDEFSSPSLQALLTDVLVWKVWTPLLKILALPDNINATFISMVREWCTCFRILYAISVNFVHAEWL